MCCRVTNCCCCFDLRAGSVTIARFLLVTEAVVLIWMSYVAYCFSGATEYVPETLQPGVRELAILIMEAAFLMAMNRAVISSVAVLLHIVLLAGAMKARRKLIQGWLVASAVLYCFALVIEGLNVALYFLYNFDIYGIYFIALILLHAGLVVYFWIVVRSYRLELDKQCGGDGHDPTAVKAIWTVPAKRDLTAQAL